MFGVKYLENYVGSITFFKELVGLTWDGVPSVTIKDGIRCESLLLGEPEVVQNPRIETAVANLLKIIRRGRKLKSSNKRKIEQEALLISKTLAFEILEDIRAVYEDAPFRRGPLRDCVVNKAECKPDFDGFGSHLRQIKDLQAKFDEANDVEKRALEEDITGRMLWLCWTGIHREVKLATKEIVLKIVKDELNAVRVARRRSWVLNEIGKIFEEALAEPVNDDHQVHLRRIMADAEKGTLKYELFRSARDMD
ncbi:hypothetical protein F5J12DRAFT_164189 [Pisolithus orientalis]|uniref:uncharacterized protein n=1 Tax=Pisolithus orientalis TaxID=936130 RepID=UPI00222467C2|nr:uncharacterized protein F5J12DRAFT_164189 [Pisolithus orientalis]KAI6003184.1 hypothetical protein F5J12DRAFT_164189 [Pisolithus orientalis]